MRPATFAKQMLRAESSLLKPKCISLHQGNTELPIWVDYVLRTAALFVYLKDEKMMLREVILLTLGVSGHTKVRQWYEGIG